jgi:hypothetical protein
MSVFRVKTVLLLDTLQLLILFVRKTYLKQKVFLLGWGHMSAQNASVVRHFVTSVVEIERNQ